MLTTRDTAFVPLLERGSFWEKPTWYFHIRSVFPVVSTSQLIQSYANPVRSALEPPTFFGWKNLSFEQLRDLPQDLSLVSGIAQVCPRVSAARPSRVLAVLIPPIRWLREEGPPEE